MADGSRERTKEVLNKTHIAGIVLTFLVSPVTFLVALWPTNFWGALEAGGYPAMSGMLLVFVVHIVESFDQPKALIRNWLIAGLWYTALAVTAVFLWGVGFEGLGLGLANALTVGPSLAVALWVRYASMRGWDRPETAFHPK